MNSGCVAQATTWWSLLLPWLPLVVVTSVLGFFTLRIANQQKLIAAEQKAIAADNKRVSQAKLKLDLFERRLAVFDRAWGLLKRVHGEPPHPIDPTTAKSLMLKEGIRDLERHLPEAMFLFGSDIASYLSTISEKCLLMRIDVVRQHRSALTDTPSAGNDLTTEQWVAFERGPMPIHQRIELDMWFTTQALTGAREKFAPYLDFSEWQ